MNHVLLDPALVVPERGGDVSASVDHWSALIGWCDRKDLRVGGATYLAATNFYTITFCGDVDSWCPTAMRREVHEAYSRLLSRRPLSRVDLSDEPELVPSYEAGESNREALSHDLSHEVCGATCWVAVATRSWPPEVKSVATGLRAPAHLALLRQSFEVSDYEIEVRRHAKFAPYDIVVFGGNPDAKALARLADFTGLDAKRVKWLGSEPRKKPPAPKKVLQHSPNGSTLVAAITGEIGHSSFAALKTACESRELLLCRVESANDLGQALLELVEGNAT